MADVPAGKLFQTQPGSPIRLTWNLKNFQRAEALFNRLSLEVAKRYGGAGLKILIRNLERNLRRASILLQQWEDCPWEPSPPHVNEDLALIMVTMQKEEKSQVGYAYWSHACSSLIRKEMEGDGKETTWKDTVERLKEMNRENKRKEREEEEEVIF
jgi:hypothetical protein